MKLSKRQNEIIKVLQKNKEPISGETLGDMFDVSRQIIVKDIGMLKAFGVEIVSTNKGYKIDTSKKLTKIIESSHDDNAIKDELNTIVDNGGVVIDIFINHPVYGVIRKYLDIKSRNGVNNFVKNMDISTPLKNLTANVHYHTISAKDEESLKKIEKALGEKGYLK